MRKTTLGMTLAAGLGAVMLTSPAKATSHVGIKIIRAGNTDTGADLTIYGHDMERVDRTSSYPFIDGLVKASTQTSLKLKLAGKSFTALSNSIYGQGRALHYVYSGYLTKLTPTAFATLQIAGNTVPTGDAPCGTGKVCAGGTQGWDATLFEKEICGTFLLVPVCAMAKIDGYLNASSGSNATATTNTTYYPELIGYSKSSASAGLDAYAAEGVGLPGGYGFYFEQAFNLIDVSATANSKATMRVPRSSLSTMNVAWYNKGPATVSGGSGKIGFKACLGKDNCVNIVTLANVKGFSQTDPMWAPIEDATTIPAWSVAY